MVVSVKNTNKTEDDQSLFHKLYLNDNTVNPCYRVHASKLKKLSFDACDSSDLIGPEPTKYLKNIESSSYRACGVAQGFNVK